MIEIESPGTQPNIEQNAPMVEPAVTAKNRVTPLEGLLQFIVVVAGIVSGAIVALIVGLVTGWIPFNC